MLNKVDVPDAADLADIVFDDIAERGWPVFRISTKSGEGLNSLKFAMAELVEKARENEPEPQPERIVIRPKPKEEGQAFSIKRQGDSEGGFLWRVTGDKPTRWVGQTDFNNPEAVGYLSDRLNLSLIHI